MFPFCHFVANNVVVVVVDKHLINESLQSFHPIIPNKDVLHNNNNYNDELPIVAWLQNTQFYGFSLISSIIIPIHIYIYKRTSIPYNRNYIGAFEPVINFISNLSPDTHDKRGGVISY